MADDIKGTWEEVIQRNEQAIRNLEQRVLQSRYRELDTWKDVGKGRTELFTLGKGNAVSTKQSSQWNLWTPKESYFGDSIEEVLYQAADGGYPVLDWITEFNER